MEGVDDCSSNNSTPCALARVTVPLLVVAAGAHYFIRDNEIHHDVAAGADREFIVIEGATHGFTECARCGPRPDAYANARRNFWDHVASWINARF